MRALVALVAVLAAACGSPVDVALERSRLARDTAPAISQSERAELAAGSTAFALDLYQALRRDARQAGKNLFYSPYSVTAAFGMAYAGARGATAEEMARALRLTLSGDRLHAALNWLDLQLASRAQASSAPSVKLRSANALWGQAGMPFQAPFLDLLAVNYDAGMQVVDFRRDAEKTRAAINDWVSQKTEGKIENLVPPDGVNRDTRLVLVNAVYFKADWRSKFLTPNTKSDSFHTAAGATVTVDMMSQVGGFAHARIGDDELVELPYEGDQLAMDIVVPGEGRFAEFEDALATRFPALLGALTRKSVLLFMPRFSYKPAEGFKLKSALQPLGMRLAFGDDADFTGITQAERLKIDDACHKGFVAVDENGTEAAAATGVVFVPVSAPLVEVTLKVDRPFFFVIRDVPTATLLFVGRILNPRE
jgi:serpin B